MEQPTEVAPITTWGRRIGDAAILLKTLLDGGSVPPALRSATRTLMLDLDDIAFEMSRD